jgi:insulin receptor
MDLMDHFLLEPDQPEELRAYSNSSSELLIEWKPPLNPNGIVTHYIVTGSWRKDDQDYYDSLDACAERKHFHCRTIG